MPASSPLAAFARALPAVVIAVVALTSPRLSAQPLAPRHGCDGGRQHCVRPFITDDARVVGAGLGQMEAWYRGDAESHQQWLLLAYGPTDRLEVTIGGVAGEDRRSGSLTYALPLVQGKFLLRPYAEEAPPGMAVILGSFLPGGQGLLKPPGHGTFGFATITQALGAKERVLLHANAGVNHLWVDGPDRTIATWGLGTQARAVGGLHVVAEIFSGDPYVPGSGTSWQAGVRHFVSDRLQLDATAGQGFAGAVQLPFWVSAGVRWVVGPWR
ncbi:MAG: hypothetical protein MUF53_07400 [Gemmatimonadaceae bacterium]|nr:hypothetical protein [Gemmatimonadaceae bacterium]